MTSPLLENFFSPKSVAVVGASDTPGRVGYAVIRNMIAGGFPGRIHPVNPTRKKVNGINAYPNLTAVGDAIDLAVIATPIERVRAVIADCAAAGIGNAIVLSAGGKETGPAGERIEREILEAARQAPLRMIGPNCVGVISTAARLNTSFLDRMPPAGNIAFISQSGAMCLAILDRAARERIGFRHFVSIGSMLDVDFGDVEFGAIVEFHLDGPSRADDVVVGQDVGAVRKNAIFGGKDETGTMADCAWLVLRLLPVRRVLETVTEKAFEEFFTKRPFITKW